MNICVHIYICTYICICIHIIGGYDTGFIRIWNIDSTCINSQNHEFTDIKKKFSNDTLKIDNNDNHNVDEKILDNVEKNEKKNENENEKSVFNFYGCDESEMYYMACHDVDAIIGVYTYI
jgi:hypothetical protein